MLAEKIQTQLLDNFIAGKKLDELRDSFVEYTKIMRELIKEAYKDGFEDGKYHPELDYDFEQSFSKKRLDVLTKGL